MGPGFRGVYGNMYWQVLLQCCVLHKLRNLAQTLQALTGLDRAAAHQFCTQFLRSADRIWQALCEDEARQIYTAFRKNRYTQQP